MATPTGFTNLSQNQLVEAIAVLVQHITAPFPNALQNGIVVNGANQIQIPDNAYNENLGQQFTATGDGTWIYLSIVEGQPPSGA